VRWGARATRVPLRANPRTQPMAVPRLPPVLLQGFLRPSPAQVSRHDSQQLPVCGRRGEGGEGRGGEGRAGEG
jgi:hypothetical protein